MAYVPHIRITAGGTLGTDVPAPEEWSCTLNFNLGSGMVVQSNVDLVFGAWADLLESDNIARSAHLKYVKASQIDASGHVVGAVLMSEGDAHGTSDLHSPPFQCCMVVSLRTGQRGPSKRGRFYLPVPNVEVAVADGLVSAAIADGFRASAATMLTACNTAMGMGRELVVASSKGYNTTVTGVNVGRVVDTQRRRRRSLSEDYDTITPI